MTDLEQLLNDIRRSGATLTPRNMAADVAEVTRLVQREQMKKAQATRHKKQEKL